MERATLKIEIPFTDHAHCIGRQGNQIQSIMLATDTHIHFPDGNRDPNGTKSNQVSITGTTAAIDQARKRIKDILPITLKFLIPSRISVHDINNDYPLFQAVRIRFGVIVLPRSYPKTGDMYCIVRGLISQPALVEATEYLIQAFYGFEASLIKVTCQIEVSEQYHVYLQTRQQSKDMCIEAIEQYTHTKIQFPMINSNSYGRRTSVIITGSPSQVCQARKLFDLCLPIILTFEISADKIPTHARIIHIKDKLNVTTIVRTRKDKFGKLVTIQSQEYNSEQLFHARSIILGLTESSDDHNTLYNSDSTSTSLSDLLVPVIPFDSSSTTIPTSHLTDSLLIPIESCYAPLSQQIDTLFVPINGITTNKKPSPIGHERSSTRNHDPDTIIWPTTNEQFSSVLLFDTPKDQMELVDPAENNHPTKLLTLLRSTNFDKYNEILPWFGSMDVDNYNNFSNNLPSYFIDDTTKFPLCSLLSI